MNNPSTTQSIIFIVSGILIITNIIMPGPLMTIIMIGLGTMLITIGIQLIDG